MADTTEHALAGWLHDAVPEVVDRWLAAIDRPPWNTLSVADRVDHLPQYLHTLFAWAFERGGDAQMPVSVVDIAIAHGEQRRRLGLDYDHVMEEVALLRRILWAECRAHGCEPARMNALDAALTVSLLASLAGYSKRELEAHGTWTDHCSRLVVEWEAVVGAQTGLLSP